MVNFTLPAPEVDSDEEDLQRKKDIIEQKVKKWALSKMAQQFCNWKKRLNNKFRSEEHTSELQSHYSISYAVFCLPKAEGVSYVGPKGKENLWKKLMVNFTLPAQIGRAHV